MHKLKLVTITGADDSVSPKELNDLSQEYPFVEWGLLLARSRTGLEPRYPSLKWLSEVSSLKINKSVHICGQLARAVHDNPADVFTTARTLVGGASRIQVNVSSYLDSYSSRSFENMEEAASGQGIQLIVQMPSFNHELLSKYSQYLQQSGDVIPPPYHREVMSCLYHPALTALHDASGGRGLAGEFSVPPQGWILPGFAGGINPDNVAEKLDAIYAMEGDFREFWIDMESGVRTDNQLDLVKVRRVLNVCKEFIRSGPFDKTIVKESDLNDAYVVLHGSINPETSKTSWQEFGISEKISGDYLRSLMKASIAYKKYSDGRIDVIKHRGNYEKDVTEHQLRQDLMRLALNSQSDSGKIVVKETTPIAHKTVFCGQINPITLEPYWQEFPGVESLDSVPRDSVYSAAIVYSKSADGTIELVKHRGYVDEENVTEVQLRLVLDHMSGSARAVGSLFEAADPLSGLHSTWLQLRD